MKKTLMLLLTAALLLTGCGTAGNPDSAAEGVKVADAEKETETAIAAEGAPDNQETAAETGSADEETESAGKDPETAGKSRSASVEESAEANEAESRSEEPSAACTHQNNGAQALSEWKEIPASAGQPKTRILTCTLCGEVLQWEKWVVDSAGHYEKTYKTVHHDAVTHEENVLGEVWTADPDGSFHQERAVTAYTDHDLTKFYVMTVDGNEVHPDLTDEQKFEMGGDGWQDGNVNDYFASLPVPEHALKADGPLIPSANGYRIAESWLEATWGTKDGFQMQTPCWYWYGAYLVADGTTETRVIGTKTVVDKEAWDETVESGQVWIEEKGHWE